MGAYEFPGRRAGDVRLGDLDGNGAVDVADLVDLVLAWGRCDAGACCLADLDLDGAVDVADLVTLILEWGRRF